MLRRRMHCAGSPSGPTDCVVAVSASGSTPFVLAALEAAQEAGALGVAVACVRDSAAGALAEHEVAVVVGPEVIAGSTRLKAGTAQKLVLNTISTVTMIRLGRTFGGLMVGVAPGNEKLRERARRNVVLASGALGGAGGRGARCRRRRCARRARLAPRRRRRGSRARAARRRRRLRAEGGRKVKLGVEAALVRGELVPGDVEVEDGGS